MYGISRFSTESAQNYASGGGDHDIAGGGVAGGGKGGKGGGARARGGEFMFRYNIYIYFSDYI